MRVLHVIPSVGPARGGPSSAVRVMAHAGAVMGLSVDIATTNDNDRDLLTVPLGTAVEEGDIRFWYFHRSARPYTASRELALWLQHNVGHYDVVHAHALFSFSTVVAASAARRWRVPYIVRPLGTLAPYGMTQHRILKRISWQLFERKILADAAAVHFTSVAEKEEALRLGVHFRSEVVPLGIDVNDYSPTRDKSWLQSRVPNAGNELTFLFLSRLHEKKQPDLVIRAFAGLRATGVQAQLIMAGAGEVDFERALRQLAHDCGVAEAVHWAGHVTGDAKSAVLRAADAFVLPSINENFGIAVVEALAAGLPCILTDGVAVHEEVAAAHAGLTVAATERGVAEGMRRLADSGIRTAMGRNARALAERAFSIDAMRSGLLAMYERAAA